MWPWEHLALGYLLYSALTRVGGTGPPTRAAALSVALATQLPDLVDKPLAWVFHLVPAGRSVGHSLLVGAPLVVLVVAVCWAARATPIGVAFGVGHLSHLAGDVAYDLLTGEGLQVAFLAWPLRTGGPTVPVDAIPHVLDLFADFLAFLATPRGGLYLALDGALVVVALVVWLHDGAPGPGFLRAAFARLARDDGLGRGR